MKSQFSLPLQNNIGSRSGIPRPEKTPDSQEISVKSIQTGLNEGIVDLYERSEINISVPDERSGVDRRTSALRKKSSMESISFQSGKITTEANINSTKQSYVNAEKKTSVSLSSFQEKKGNLLDTWA